MELDRRSLLRYSGMAAASLALRTKAFAWADDAPIATTTAGKISGLVQDGVNVFKGVPYGGDTARTRFKAPVPPTKWTGVKDCTAFTTMAPQIMGARTPPAGAGRPGAGMPGAGGPGRAAGTSAGGAGAAALRTSSSGVPGAPRDQGVQSEDCLHLNVFTRGLRDKKKRPVLVYFHGGAYNNGTVNSDLYDGKRLCHRGDVVVVTVNHRLNAFGYMYLGDLAPEYKDSGNAGQLDLVLALKWVKENIAEFGGDPTRVLIFATRSFPRSAPSTPIFSSTVFVRPDAISIDAPLICCPLIVITRWNSPFATGVAISAAHFAPPPDCPKISTLAGSPPNSAIFSFTHFSASTRSNCPAFPESLYSGARSPRYRYPNELSRWLTVTTTTSPRWHSRLPSYRSLLTVPLLYAPPWK